jgi:hypothetical protein
LPLLTSESAASGASDQPDPPGLRQFFRAGIFCFESFLKSEHNPSKAYGNRWFSKRDFGA